MALRRVPDLNRIQPPAYLIFDAAFKAIGREHLTNLQTQELASTDLTELRYVIEDESNGLFWVQKNENDPPMKRDSFKSPCCR